MRGLIPDKTKAEVFNRLRIFDVRSAIAGRGHARSHFLEQDSPDFCDDGRLSLLPRLRIFDVRSAIAGRGHARSHFLEQDSPDFCGTWLYNEGRLSLLPWHTAKARVMADEQVQRRHRFNDFTESQQQTLVAAAVPQKTKQATDFWWGVFESFCREKCVSVDVKTISASALADVLKKFYGGLTTKKGGTYQATSYLSARAAIQRKVTAANRPFNLRVDSEFRESNIVLDAVLKHNKVSGQAKQRKHKDVITDLDKDRFAKYFEGVLESQDTQQLQVFCWYNLARHLGLRGTEVFVKINKTDVIFKTDEHGQEYATLSADFNTKNTQSGADLTQEL